MARRLLAGPRGALGGGIADAELTDGRCVKRTGDVERGRFSVEDVRQAVERGAQGVQVRRRPDRGGSWSSHPLPGRYLLLPGLSKRGVQLRTGTLHARVAPAHLLDQVGVDA